MYDRDMWWKISLIAAAVTVAYVSVVPLERNIKLGIDLRGGYSLVYEIDDTGLDPEQKATLAADVMAILKERVDPNGVLNLVWRPIGHNRLEIQMPRPPASVSAKRDQYVAAQEQILATVVRRGDVLLALSRDGDERARALADLERGMPSRKPLLARLAEAHDALRKAETGEDQAALEAATKAYNEALAAVMMTNVQTARLEAAIQADAAKPFRAQELAKLKSEYADLAPRIDAAVKAYDEWRNERGREGTLDDPADLQQLLRGAGVLEFRVLAEPDREGTGKYDAYVANLAKRGPRRAAGENYQWMPIENPNYFFHTTNIDIEFDRVKRGHCVAERYGDKYYVLAHTEPNKTLLHDPSGAKKWRLVSAVPDRDQEGLPAVAFQLDEAGGNRFQKLTSENIQRQLCIFLDGQAVSSANIISAIRIRGQISGKFSIEEVQRLCQKLNAGSLPGKLKEPPISVRGIGPSLGEANREAGKRAAIYGCIAIAVFMIAYYFYSGAIAVIATTVNLLLTAMILAVLNATLTLPAIAGLVLGVGMAVDANVLINERIREELKRGAALRAAIKAGYEKAFSAILDSNVTTILTCAILYWVGSEEIRGFGLTLGWSVIINLVTGVYLTRVFFEFMDSPRVPPELLRYPLSLAAAAAAAGGLLWALGIWINPPELRATSVSIFFAKILVVTLPATALVLLILAILRALHRGVQGGSSRGLPMLAVVGVPNVDWHGRRHLFLGCSAILAFAGAALFATRDPRQLYDIEFLGGTSAQIDLKQPGSLTEADVLTHLARARQSMLKAADQLAGVQVSAAGSEFVVHVSGIPTRRLASIIRAELADYLPPDGVREDPERDSHVFVRFRPDAKIRGAAPPSPEIIAAEVAGAATRVRTAAEEIADSQVQAIQDIGAGAGPPASFEIVTRETSRELFVDAIISSMEDYLDIQPSLTFEFRKDELHDDAPYFAIVSEDLGKVIGDPSVTERVASAIGGVAIVAEGIDPPQTLPSLKKRLRDMRLQPGRSAHGWRPHDVIGLTVAGNDGQTPTFSRVAVIVSDENYTYEEGSEENAAWRAELAEPELRIVRQALERQTSLGAVRQFAPQVAAEAKVRAYLAVAASWLMIVIYLWFRFGDVYWGLAAVIALVFDVIAAVGVLAASSFVAATALGPVLMIDPFRIDLAIVAALLTIIGYSVNDKIVVFDRIRENRGKLRTVSPEMVNQSISQTLSRTILTGGGVLLTILIMYIWGGRGIHGFNFVMLVGVLAGTYSSITVASPMLVALHRRHEGAT